MLNSRITYKIFIFLFIFISCEKDDKIPSYLKVNNVNLNYNQNFGSITENITDVWVYIEDNLQGVYEIPV